MLGPDWRKSTRSHTNGCLAARWRTPTVSTGVNCLAARFTKPSRSGSYGCVQARMATDGEHGAVEVCDTKLGEDSPVVVFTPGAWQMVLDAVRAGEWEPFDWVNFTPLDFTGEEKAAFLADVRERDTFDLPAEAVTR